MRRSKRITTLTLGGACLLVLASCGEDVRESDVFGSLDECIARTGDRTSCGQELAAAQKLHEETAPKYEQKASCEEVYGEGKCVPAQSASGGNWFMPAMMGFMMGRMMGGGMSQPVYYDRRGYAYAGGQPWQGRDATARSSGGYSRVGTTAGSSSSSVSRGGFGATGSALSAGS